jgi:hypothetical protein
MLHVLNGDATATVFAAAGLPGDVLVWRDILVEGSVTVEWTAADALATRTTVLAERLAVDPERYRRSVREQEGFPSVGTGLNAIETVTLATLESGARVFGDLFRVVTAEPRVRRHGMGDLQLAAYVRGLAPLVSIPSADVRSADIAITALGREVLAGRRDWPSVREIDVWLGGVHVQGHSPRWRWDGARRRLVESAAA